MKQLVTTGIVLSRTDYGEADRILTLLTPEQGKLRLMAKGVRRIKSKLAGGIELFSVSNITYIQGKREVGTLLSSRLLKHYGHIVEDINRTMLGYELIKQLNKATEDQPEAEYFDLLQQAFAALDDLAIDLGLIKLWFTAQLLRLDGHTPNLQTDITHQKLEIDKKYEFSYDDMAFINRPDGQFTADHIKVLRLLFSGNYPQILQQIISISDLIPQCLALLQTLRQLH